MKEVELANAQETSWELQSDVEGLKREAVALRDKLSRAEQRAVLAERETGFLQAMMVRIPISRVWFV